MRRFCTVTTTNAADTFNGNGVTTVFNLSFVFFEASSLVVTLVQPDGTEIAKTLTTDYTVSGGNGATGSITTTSFTPASGEKLVVERVEPATQGTDYVNNDTFDAETTETRFDRIVMALQNALDRTTRSIKIKTADASGVDTDLPSPTALKTFRWNSGATALEETDDPKVSADAAAVSATNAATSETNAAASASAASTSETNAATSETNAATSETNAATSETNAATSAAKAEDQRGAVALGFTFSTATSMADPGTGTLRFNNATPASVTAIAIDALSADDGNPDVSDFLALLDAVTSTVKGYLTIRKIGDPSLFMTFDVTGVTDNGGWLQATVTHVQGSTLPSNGDSLAISIGRTGDAQTNSMPSGTAASPGFPFSADPDTGIYRVAENVFGIATGGVQAARFDASQNLIVAGTLTASAIFDDGQLIPDGALRSVQVFTSSGTWNKPSGLQRVFIQVVGGGGGGGGASGSGAGAGGGGGGGAAIKMLEASALGASETVTVGTGGTGGSAGANPGNNGNSSSFGAHASASGGSGGTQAGGPGGQGGIGSGGDLNIGGGGGGPGADLEDQSGSGGSSVLGGGGAGSNDGTALAGRSYGGGGGGAAANASGGNGAAGVVVVWEYF